MKRRTSSPSEDDRLEFERLFRTHYSDVLAYARRRTSAEAALDAAADTFLIAWRRIEDVPNDALPWLLGVARRAIANQARADRRRDALRAKIAMLKKAHEVRTDVNADPAILAALARLSGAEREAILLVAWEGLTPAQAAAVLGCSGLAFRARLHRARRRLARALTDGRSAEEHREARITTIREEAS